MNNVINLVLSLLFAMDSFNYYLPVFPLPEEFHQQNFELESNHLHLMVLSNVY